MKALTPDEERTVAIFGNAARNAHDDRVMAAAMSARYYHRRRKLDPVVIGLLLACAIALAVFAWVTKPEAAAPPRWNPFVAAPQ